MSDRKEPELDWDHAPDLQSLATLQASARCRLLAIVASDLYHRLRAGLMEPRDRALLLRELRLYLQQLQSEDAHEGAVRVEQMEQYLQRIQEAESRVRGSKPAKAAPPTGTGKVGGLH